MPAVKKDIEDENFYKEKYEELLHEYQEFAYIVSHDLQSPVRQMRGFLDILLNELDIELNEQNKCYKEMIDHAAKEAGDALDALLEFSRLNTEEKHFETLDMNKIVEGVLDQFISKIEKTKAQIEVGKLPSVTGDRSLIYRLITYLLSNAFKFRKPGQTLDIKIGVKEESGVPVFFIADNGIGMPQDKVEDAYIMFRKLNATELYPGGGTGLTFAKKIIDIHEGKIWTESEPEKGTIVYFTLPM